jgi:uncharacterized protein with HEPN domain
MTRAVLHVLFDILESISRIEDATRGMTLSQFESDWRTKYAVQRCIEIISEASRAIPDDLKAAHPEIPWPSVRDIGNVIRHQYEGISDPLIWRVVEDELPRLKAAVEAMRDGNAGR